MSEDATGSGLGGATGGGLEGGASGTGGRAGTSGAGGAGAGGGTSAGGAAAGLGGLAGRLPNGGASLLGVLARAGPLPVHGHLTPETGGEIDYLRTQWGTDHLAAGDPHSQYATDLALDAHATAPDPHDAYLTTAEANALFLTPAEGDSRYPLKTDPDPYPQYLTAGEVPPADVTVNVDGSLTSTESPTNTFALAVKLSPDAGNALALRATGLYATDTTGGGAAEVTITGDNGIGVTESPANTFALATRVSADADNTLTLHADGLYVAAGAIPPEYVTDSELTAALGPYATDADLAAHTGAADPHSQYATDSDLSAHAAAGDPHPGYVLEALADAKGDLFAASGADAMGRLALGTDGHVLTADSTQPLGVRWAAGGGGGAYVDEAGDTMSGALILQNPGGTANVLQAKITGDANPRFRMDASGKLEWGPGGASAPNVAMSRVTGGLQLQAALQPDASSTRNLGTSSAYWWQTFFQIIHLNSTGYLENSAANTANAGFLRLVNANQIAWRNAANTGNHTLSLDASDRFAFSSDVLVNEATPTVLLKQAADTQPRAQLSDTALAFGPGGTTATDTALTRSGAALLQVTGALHAPSAAFEVKTGTAPGTARLALAQTGTLTLTPDAGQNDLMLTTGWIDTTAGGFAFRTGGVARVIMQPTIFYPNADNAVACGFSTSRWTAVYAVNGTIQTSAADAKQDITPLDPAACAQAVLDTDWVSFEYTPPPLTPGPPGETVAQSTARVKAHSTSVQETAFARKQRGFVLGSPGHRVSHLFGLADRKSASPSSDLAVVAAALQNVLNRLQALEGA